MIKVVLSGETYLLTLIEVVINISDEVVQAAATLAVTLLKKLPNVCMEQDLIGDLVSNVRLNPVRRSVGSRCVFYKSRVFHYLISQVQGDITSLRQGESARKLCHLVCGGM